MNTTTTTRSLVAEAERIAAQLAALRAEGDELRRLPDAAWQLLQEGGFLRSLQPARFGGGEVPLLDFVDAIIALSRANPSAGWVAGVVGVHPWQLALFDEQAQQDMWAADPTTMHSSSYNPTGKAEAVDGGYRVSGRWSFSSGCDHCHGVNLGAVIRAENGQSPIPDFRSFLLLPGQYRIDDTWFVAGLKGTGSKDIVVDDAFVPAHRSQSHVEYAIGNVLPGQALNDGPLYRLPWAVVFNMALASSVLGSAKGFFDLWVEQNATRTVPFAGPLADDPITQRRLADATWDLDAAITVLRADAQRMWDMAEAHETPTSADRAQMRWNMNRGCERVAQAVSELMRAASGRVIYLDHPLQARFQDLQGALGHAFLVPDGLAKAVGGNLLGTSKPELVM